MPLCGKRPEARIKQMAAITAIIRIMISEREVGSPTHLEATTNCRNAKSRLQDTGLKLLPLGHPGSQPPALSNPPTTHTLLFPLVNSDVLPRDFQKSFANEETLSKSQNCINMPYIPSPPTPLISFFQVKCEKLRLINLHK